MEFAIDLWEIKDGYRFDMKKDNYVLNKRKHREKERDAGMEIG